MSALPSVGSRLRGRDPTFPWWVSASEAETGQQAVEQGGNATQRVPGAVEEAGDCAQQVAQQVAGTGDGGDVEVDRSQVDHQPEQVQMQWAKVQREDGAAVWA